MRPCAIAVIVIGIVFQYFFIFRAKTSKAELSFKTLASACFVIAGLLACLQIGGTVALLVFFGLVCGLFGDFFLHYRFINKSKIILLIGVFFFLVGHILYIIAMFFTGAKWYVGVIVAVLGLPALAKYIFSHDVDFGKLVYLGTTYMAILLFFTGMSLGYLLAKPSLYSAVFLIGSVFFLFSDTMWCLNNFCKTPKKIYRTACLVSYYFAQNLFVISLLLTR